MVQIIAGTTPENYRYNLKCLPCFLSFVGYLAKMQLTNYPGVIVIAEALTLGMPSYKRISLVTSLVERFVYAGAG